MSEPYRPIDCATHSEYELAIMRRQRLALCWDDDTGTTRDERLRPTDLRTENGAEYLIGESAEGEPRRLRLDRIRQWRVITD